MAFTVTDRGAAGIDSASTATATMVSASFTPPKHGTHVVVVTGLYGSAGVTHSIADTFSGTGPWAVIELGIAAAGGTIRTSVFYATTGPNPGAGTITVTRSAGTFSNGAESQFLTVTANGIVNFAQSASANGPATSLTVTFGATPRSTSLVIGGHGYAAATTPGVVQPSGWTEVRDVRDAQVGNHEVAYKATGAVINPTWTGIDTSAGADSVAVAVEFTETITSAAPQDRDRRRFDRVRSRWATRDRDQRSQFDLYRPASVAASTDQATTGVLYAGGAVYAPAGHDAAVTGLLAAGSAPYAVSGHDAAVTGLLAAGSSASAVVGHDQPTTGVLYVGSALFAVVGHDQPTTGVLYAGSDAFATVGHDQPTTGVLYVGSWIIGGQSTDQATFGVLYGGSALYAPVGHNAIVTGLLVAGSQQSAPVGHDAAVTGLLVAGPALYAPVSHNAAVTGLLVAGSFSRALIGNAAPGWMVRRSGVWVPVNRYVRHGGVWVPI